MMFQSFFKSKISSGSQEARKFEPKRLRLYKTDGLVNSYHYGRAIVSMAADEERIYISVDRPLPSEITVGNILCALLR